MASGSKRVFSRAEPVLAPEMLVGADRGVGCVVVVGAGSPLLGDVERAGLETVRSFERGRADDADVSVVARSCEDAVCAVGVDVVDVGAAPAGASGSVALWSGSATARS